MSRRTLQRSDLPANVLNTKYAVRGKLVLRANELEHELRDPSRRSKYPFSRITYCNIGNPQELGQQPITFNRQVIAMVEYPALIEHAAKANIPSDAVRRAQHILQNMVGGTGAYTGSQGLELVREEVATFIAKRDGHLSEGHAYVSPKNIFLSDGASPSVQRCLALLIRGAGYNDGVMVPIPQYPLYSATIANLGGHLIEYYLDEEKNWNLDVHELDRAYSNAQKKGITPRGLVVINPGNPTGQVLPRENIEEIIDFASRRNLLLLADEVYQENIYTPDKPFISFKKVKYEMGSSYRDLGLVSFHSTSKGLLGECGKRGGYVEMDGIEAGVQEEYYKLCSIGLCPNVIGQVMLSLMVNPPKEGDESYALYQSERDAIFRSLQRRAQLVTAFFNSMTGVTCNKAEGAMYAFPRITIPPRAVEEAKKREMAPDMFYCSELLENTGVCVVPGSGFGQRDGTYHFRTTILPQEEVLQNVLQSIKSFHESFMQKWS